METSLLDTGPEPASASQIWNIFYYNLKIHFLYVEGLCIPGPFVCQELDEENFYILTAYLFIFQFQYIFIPAAPNNNILLLTLENIDKMHFSKR
jgi:hypothetical protein